MHTVVLRFVRWNEGNEILWHIVNMAKDLIDIKALKRVYLNTLLVTGGACAHQKEIILPKLFSNLMFACVM